MPMVVVPCACALALAAKATQCDRDSLRGDCPMAQLCRPLLPAVVLFAGLPMLAGCSSSGTFSNPFTTAAAAPPPPAAAPVVPPSVRPDEIVGRWGLASYHREQD